MNFDVVLNIKRIAVKWKTTAPAHRRRGEPGAVAGRKHPDRGDVEILNPDHVICTLDEGPNPHGVHRRHRQGPCARDRNRSEDAPIGLIPVDSLDPPVKKVSYKVENTREGEASTMTS